MYYKLQQLLLFKANITNCCTGSSSAIDPSCYFLSSFKLTRLQQVIIPHYIKQNKKFWVNAASLDIMQIVVEQS